MRLFLDIVRALADENRLRALLALKDRELCVCQIMAMLCLAPSTVSKHMTVLKQAGLVDSVKRGRWVYYRLPDRAANPDVACALEWVFGSLQEEARIKDDASRLCCILCMTPEELFKKLVMDEGQGPRTGVALAPGPGE